MAPEYLSLLKLVFGIGYNKENLTNNNSQKKQERDNYDST